jgi:hypothetical protein
MERACSDPGETEVESKEEVKEEVKGKIVGFLS